MFSFLPHQLYTEFVPENYPFIAQYLLHWCKDPFPGLELVRICILSVGEVGMTPDFERFQLDFSDSGVAIGGQILSLELTCLVSAGVDVSKLEIVLNFKP
jgi:hypothetical protein